MPPLQQRSQGSKAASTAGPDPCSHEDTRKINGRKRFILTGISAC